MIRNALIVLAALAVPVLVMAQSTTISIDGL